MSLSKAQRYARLSRVGASEVAALLEPSKHPYVTKQGIYDRIVHGLEPEVNDAMLTGQLMEPYILDAARRRWRLPAIACTRAYIHHLYPVTASPDAYMGDGEGLVEVKATSNNWADRPPEYVVYQVQCQLWLARRSYAHVVVLQGSRLRLFTVERDSGLVRSIEEGVRRFSERHLLPLIPPTEPEKRDWELEKR